MIKYVSGDILLTTSPAVAHGVAPNDDFKQGLALSLRERWPSLYKDFRHFCKTTHPEEGSLWTWKGVDAPLIINLLTQQHPPSQGGTPGKATLPFVNSALKELVKLAETDKLKSVAVTRLATGVGALPWSEVKPLLEHHLKASKTVFYVYETYRAGEKALEG